MASNFGLCAACWAATPFISGLACDKCGAALPGDDDGRPEYCDDCIAVERPWHQGRAVFLYKDKARDMVLSLKHGDRLDLIRPAGAWLARAAEPLLIPDMIVAPIPLHWTRLFRRRYNQSALLARAMTRITGQLYCPDLLIRARNSPSQEGKSREDRFANLQGAIRAHPRRLQKIAGRHVLLVDDVMTSGATFSAAAEACLAAGATRVSVLSLARVAKDT